MALLAPSAFWIQAKSSGPDEAVSKGEESSVVEQADSSTPAAIASAANDGVESVTKAKSPELEGRSEEVLVETGTRTRRSIEESPLPVSVVDRKAIEERSAVTLETALESETSVYLERNFAGVGIRMGGLGPEYTSILVDGRRLTGRMAGMIDVRSLRLENVEQIEMLRGPGSVAYGADALAGVVNIVTRRPSAQGEGAKAWKGEMTLRGGSRLTFDGGAYLQFQKKEWFVSAFGNFDRADPWYRDPSIEATTGDGTQGWNVGGSVGWQRRAVSVQMRADYDRRKFYGVDEFATGATLDRQSLRERFSSRLETVIEGSDSRLAADVAFTTFRNQYAADQRGSDALDEYQDTRNPGLQAGLQLDQFVGEHTVMSGIDLQAEWLEGERLSEEQVSRQRLGMFLQDLWEPGTSIPISIFPGLRLDYDSFFDLYLTPRIAFAIRPRNWAFRFSFGRGYRAPGLKEMFIAFDNPGVGYQVRGNPNLRPETSWSTTLDVTWTPIRWLQLGSFVFNHSLKDAIVTNLAAPPSAGQPTLYSYTNVGYATSQGAELRLGLEPWSWSRLGGSFQWTRAIDLDTDRRLPGQPALQGALDLRFRFGPERWKSQIGGRLSWVGVRNYYEPDPNDPDEEDVLTVEARPYTQLDLRVSQRLTSYCEIFLTARNLLNAGDATLNPMPPRSFFAGVKGQF